MNTIIRQCGYHGHQPMIALNLYGPGHEPLMLKNNSSCSTPMQKLLSQDTSLTSTSLQLVDRRSVSDAAGAVHDSEAHYALRIILTSMHPDDACWHKPMRTLAIEQGSDIPFETSEPTVTVD
jgi:hypothetical protein